jgi:hypothetical protein
MHTKKAVKTLFLSVNQLSISASAPPRHPATRSAERSTARSKAAVEETPIAVPWSPVPRDSPRGFPLNGIGHFRLDFQVNDRFRRARGGRNVSVSRTLQDMIA